MDIHSYPVTVILENPGGGQIHDQPTILLKPTILSSNRNRLSQWIRQPVHLLIHHSRGHVLRDHLMQTEPQAVQAAPGNTGPCPRSKVDEDDKKDGSSHHLLNHENVDYQACLTGHVLISRAAFKDCEATTLRSSLKNIANYMFDGSTRRNQRCV